jgi:hypothetical protein
VEDLDREVVPLRPQELLRLLFQNYAGSVVWVDDLVALLELTLELLYLQLRDAGVLYRFL